MRIVLDTNLLVSGLVYGGLPRQLLNAVREDEVELCTSEVLLAELLEVLGREKFARQRDQTGPSPQAVVDELRAIAILVTPPSVPRVVLTDPDDDHVLAAAVAGAVDLIASGDRRDLLPLGSHAGIPICTAREALIRLGLIS